MDLRPRPTGVRRIGALVVACALALAAAPAAEAAYAPQLSVTIDPATASSRIALTSVVTQEQSEEANKKVTVSFPLGLGFALSALSVAPVCTPAQFSAKSCPADSQIGTAEADAPPIGTLTGNVYFGGALTGTPVIYVFLSNSLSKLLGQDQALQGKTIFRADGGVDTVFDNLPSTTTTRFQLKLDGPPRSLLQAPPKCGAYTFVGKFLSQSGTMTQSSSIVSVTGCSSPPVNMSKLRLKPARIVQGRTAKLSFTLDGSASVTVTVRRVGKRKVLSRRSFGASSGTNTVPGVGRGLRPGTYVVRASALDSTGNSSTHSLRLKVKPKPRKR